MCPGTNAGGANSLLKGLCLCSCRFVSPMSSVAKISEVGESHCVGFEGNWVGAYNSGRKVWVVWGCRRGPASLLTSRVRGRGGGVGPVGYHSGAP